MRGDSLACPYPTAPRTGWNSPWKADLGRPSCRGLAKALPAASARVREYGSLSLGNYSDCRVRHLRQVWDPSTEAAA